MKLDDSAVWMAYSGAKHQIFASRIISKYIAETSVHNWSNYLQARRILQEVELARLRCEIWA